MHGYDLHNAIQERLRRVWRLSQSQLYAVLKRLEAQGLILAQLEEGERRKPRRVFSATEVGRERFGLWLNAPSDCSTRILRLEFLTRLFFARELAPASLASIVAEQEAAVRRQLASHRKLLEAMASTDPISRLGMDLKVRQLASVLAWFEESLPTILEELPENPL
jgi:DNA-binding PadR family transcriptional regulator